MAIKPIRIRDAQTAGTKLMKEVKKFATREGSINEASVKRAYAENKAVGKALYGLRVAMGFKDLSDFGSRGPVRDEHSVNDFAKAIKLGVGQLKAIDEFETRKDGKIGDRNGVVTNAELQRYTKAWVKGGERKLPNFANALVGFMEASKTR